MIVRSSFRVTILLTLGSTPLNVLVFSKEPSLFAFSTWQSWPLAGRFPSSLRSAILHAENEKMILGGLRRHTGMSKVVTGFSSACALVYGKSSYQGKQSQHSSPFDDAMVKLPFRSSLILAMCCHSLRGILGINHTCLDVFCKHDDWLKCARLQPFRTCSRKRRGQSIAHEARI